MSSSRNSDECRHYWVWLYHDNAPVHKSLVAQQALSNFEFVRPNHPAYSLDLAPSNYFLIRNLKYIGLPSSWNLVYGQWITEDRCQGMVWESKQKIPLSWHKLLRTKVENVHWCCMRMSQNDSMCDIICYLIIYLFIWKSYKSTQVAKLVDRPS